VIAIHQNFKAEFSNAYFTQKNVKHDTFQQIFIRSLQNLFGEPKIWSCEGFVYLFQKKLLLGHF